MSFTYKGELPEDAVREFCGYSRSTAKNYEWDGPYTAWSVDEVCSCGSHYCEDCRPFTVFERTTKPGLGFRLLLTYYKLKRWLFKPTPWNK